MTVLPPSDETRKLLREKEEEKRGRLRKVAVVYATILMANSNYANTQQERQFFESLYDFTKRVLFTINNRKHWHAIETELDRIFRSSFFNLSLRKNKTSSQQTNNAANVMKLSSLPRFLPTPLRKKFFMLRKKRAPDRCRTQSSCMKTSRRSGRVLSA